MQNFNSQEIFYRTANDVKVSDLDSRTLELSFSSETPVQRSFGQEVLGHNDGEMVTDFIGSKAAPLLLDHNPEKQIGVIERVWLDDGKGRAAVRFGKSQLAQEILDDVEDGIRSNVSVGYKINQLERQEDSDVVRAVSWQPYEISFVSIPADQNVGVGRAQQEQDFAKEQVTMTKEVKQAEEVVAATPKAETINVDALRKEAANDAEKRVSEILSLGRKFDLNDQAEEFVREGKTANDFKDVILVEQSKRSETIDNKSTEIGMNDNEVRSYSLMRAINAQASGDWSNAGLEREASKAVEAQVGGSQRGGFFIPTEWQTRGTMVTTASSAIGEHLVGTDHMSGSFIEALTERLVVKQAGATVLTGLVGNVAIPKAGATATAAWVGEDAAASESSVGTAQVTLAPKTVTANQSISHQLLRQSAPGAEQMVTNSIINQIAIAIDTAALNGGGSNEPTGIIAGGTNQHATATDGSAPTWDMINDLIKLVDVDNALIGNLSFVTNAKVMSALRTTGKQASGVEGNFILGMDNTLAGYSVYNSQVISSTNTKGSSGATLSAIVFGNFSDLVIGQWGTLEIVVDPYTNSTSGQVRVTALSDVDVALLHGESFSFTDEVIAA